MKTRWIIIIAVAMAILEYLILYYMHIVADTYYELSVPYYKIGFLEDFFRKIV